MAKRGRPRKIKVIEEIQETERPPEPENVRIEGIAPGQLDIDDELDYLGGRESDPYYDETARFHRNSDDPMGGVGLNFGDW
jgi:hypothetical protein